MQSAFVIRWLASLLTAALMSVFAGCDSAPSSRVAGTRRACSGPDLKARADQEIPEAMSNTKLIVHVTNESTTACSMPPTSPNLVGVRRDGSVVAFKAVGGGTYFGNPPPLTGPLLPGASALLWINGGLPGTCGIKERMDNWKALQLRLPDGTRVEFTTGFDAACGVFGISLFGADERPP